MKLYATVTSERATKGQGGNYLDIYIKDENKQDVAVLHASLLNGKPRVSLIASNYDTACTLEFDAQEIIRKYKQAEKTARDFLAPTKGKKQEGEVCEHGRASDENCTLCQMFKR